MSVPATLSLFDAAEREWPLVVIGAGPAGSVAAHELAGRGLDVLLVDQSAFPRDKVCGCCLNGRALAALSSAGLAHVPERAGALRVDSVRLGAGRAEVELPLPAGASLSRSALDAGLVRAAIERGVRFLPSTRATLLSSTEGPHRLHLENAGAGSEVRAHVILAADGLGSTILAKAGIVATARTGSRLGAGVVIACEERFYRSGQIYMATGTGGYLGLVRLEDGRLDLACAADREAVRHAGGPGPLAVGLLERTGWPIPAGLADAPWRGTAPLTRQARRPGGRRLFALGDAVGYIEPFTGEGMAWAIASAVAVAPLAARAVDAWSDDLLDAWQARHRQLIGSRQHICRMASAVLRRPWLTATLVRLLAWLPGLAGSIVGRLNRPDRLQTFPGESAP